MIINVQSDCGNSPKKKLIEEMTILFASYKIDEVSSFFSEDISWTLVGDEPIVGKALFAHTLKQMSGNKVLELSIHTIVTHGKEAAISGEMKMENGTTYGFSDFYMFTSAKASKVQSIRSYVIQLKSD